MGKVFRVGPNLGTFVAPLPVSSIFQSEADSDEAINVAITQIDEIINTNNETQHPFTLALLMIRAELEQSLKVNNHIEQSKSLYFGLIGSMITQSSQYNPSLHKRKNFVANLGKLLSTIRGTVVFFYQALIFRSHSQHK